MGGKPLEADEAAQIVVECDTALSADIDWDIETRRVYRINVRGGTATTAAGVGVGDAVSKAVAAYGAPRSQPARATYVSFFRARRVSVSVDAEAAARYHDQPISSAKDDMLAKGRIRAILVTGQRRERTASVDCLESAGTQTQIDLCAASEAERMEKALADLVSQLRTTLQPAEWKRLAAIQKDWRLFAEHQCRWEGGLFEGGSIAPSVVSWCHASLSRQRIDSLKIFLCEGAGMTGECDASRRF